MDDIKKFTIAGRVALVNELLGGIETCPTCGHETEKPSIITPEQAKELLGFKDKKDD